MSSSAVLNFRCPKCSESNTVYLNVSAKRRRGDNNMHCSRCSVKIEIQIAIVVEEEERPA